MRNTKTTMRQARARSRRGAAIAETPGNTARPHYRVDSRSRETSKTILFLKQLMALGDAMSPEAQRELPPDASQNLEEYLYGGAPD